MVGETTERMLLYPIFGNAGFPPKPHALKANGAARAGVRPLLSTLAVQAKGCVFACYNLPLARLAGA